MRFNHALVSVTDIPRSLFFYHELLGFELIEKDDEYARLKSPGGDETIGLHLAEDASGSWGDGIRLYFETADLDGICARLAGRGISIRGPENMRWGWRHAYLHDPDGHELSLYLAGAKRLQTRS